MTAAQPAVPAASPATPSAPRWLVSWLIAVAVSVMVMIVLGGVVRLAHAGLSITEWAPVRGVVPPLTEAAWNDAFDAYRQSPEYQLVNAGMSLEAFKHIYWLEWGHRLLGRLAGLLVAVPLAVGLLRRQFDVRLRRHLLGIGILFAMQGVMGWLMVASGLVDKPWVSPFRLALHLYLALALLGWIVWLLLDRTAGRPVEPGGGVLRGPATTALVVLLAQIGLGALVAGNRAGWISDTFPRMQGQWVPAGLSAAGLSGIFTDPLVLHFAHRWFAFGVVAVIFWLHARARSRGAPLVVGRLTAAAALLVLFQVALGIAVVLGSVAAPLASVHQAVGVLLFAVLLALRHQAREPQAT